jgi:hypothetical protein
MSLESQLFRHMKEGSAQFARNKHPEQTGVSRVEIARRRQAATERRDTFLEQTAALLERAEQRDIEQEQKDVLRVTVLDLLPVLLEEYQESEMHKSILERLEASTLEFVLFVEIMDSMTQKQKKELTLTIQSRVRTLFSDPGFRRELEQHIEAHYESAICNMVTTYRQLNPEPISDAKAQEAFDELLHLASFRMIPVASVEKHRQKILEQWHKEYYDMERQWRILEEELGADSADELRSVLSIPHFRALLFRIKEYNHVLHEGSVSSRAREAWGILVARIVESRLHTLVETTFMLSGDMKDLARRRNRIKRSPAELALMSKEEKRQYADQMGKLKRYIKLAGSAEYTAENVLMTPRDILRQEITDALAELGPEKIAEVWEQFFEGGKAFVQAWKMEHSTNAIYLDKHNRGYFLDSRGSSRILTENPPSWFAFFEPKQFFTQQIDMEEILQLQSAQPTFLPKHLKQRKGSEEPSTSP